MIKKNPLVMMLALLSATPHLTLWAVESNQGPKKVSAQVSKPMFDINDDSSRSLILANKLSADLLKRINEIDKIRKNAKKFGPYDKCIEEIESRPYDKCIEAIALVFRKSSFLADVINSDIFKDETKSDKIEDTNKVKYFLGVLTENIKNFKEYVLNDMQTEVQAEKDAEIDLTPVKDQKTPEGGLTIPMIQNFKAEVLKNMQTEFQSDTDEKAYRKIRELARDCVKIDPTAMSTDGELKNQPLIALLTNISQIRKDLMKNDPENYAKYKSFNLVTEKLYQSCIKFKHTFNNLINTLIKKFNNLNK